MNNQFTPKVSDIITYSKEEANRLFSTYIGPEHLLLGLLRDGQGRAVDALCNLLVNLKELKREIEQDLKVNASDEANYDANINFNEEASRILKL